MLLKKQETVKVILKSRTYNYPQGTDMVNTVNSKQVSITSFSTSLPVVATRLSFIIFPAHGQRRGHHLTTVDQSDMRGLGTVWIGFVVELPQSKDGSFSCSAYSHSAFEGSPNRDRAPGDKLEGLCVF